MLTRLACLLATVSLITFSSLAQSTRNSETGREKAPASKQQMKLGVELLEGKVLDVLEGDTITMLTKNGAFCTVRLLGIDAPDNKQDYFKKSKKSLSELIEGEDVKVLAKSRDTGDRYIGSVYLEGRDIALVQIERGMAWHYKYVASEQTSDARKKYAEAQEKARTEKVGLWESRDPKAPWDFRGEAPPPEVKATEAGAEGSTDASGRKYILGPRGGCYYVSESGRKIYVKDKSLCGAAQDQ